VLAVVGVLLTVAIVLFSGPPDHQMSAHFTDNSLSDSEVNASAVLQGIEANNISVSVVNTQIQTGADTAHTPRFQVYINDMATPIGDHAVIALGQDRTVRIRVQNVGQIAAENASMSVYLPLESKDLLSTEWTRQAPPINPKTKQEVPSLLHLWAVAAGGVPEKGWFRTPLLSISNDSPHPRFTRRELEDFGFEFSGPAEHCPADFVFHVLPVIVSVNSARSTDHRFNLFFTY
jgi:hypothetical protein